MISLYPLVTKIAKEKWVLNSTYANIFQIKLPENASYIYLKEEIEHIKSLFTQ